MTSIKEVLVEKKQPYDVEAKQLFDTLKNIVNIKNLTNVRVINKYLVNNINNTLFQYCIKNVFSEPPVDNIVWVDKNKEHNVFAVKSLPGQFNQREESAEQCIKFIDPTSKAKVNFIKVIVLEGKLSKDDIAKIKKFYINPIESIEVNPFDNEIKTQEITINPIKTYDIFSKLSKEQLIEFKNKHELAMSVNDLLLIQQYFISEKREPTETEIKVLDTYWSDHCRHTTFNTILTNVKIEDGVYNEPIKLAYKKYLLDNKQYNKNKPISLMNIATIVPKKLLKIGLLKDLDISEEINACSIKVDLDVNGSTKKSLLMFKNETHNHPTEIEPFGGASTCLGGAIRDPLSGRSYVYQAMRVTGSADPTTPIKDTLPGKLPQRTITIGASNGYSSYGNQIGLATGQVDEVYHPNYVAKRLEVGAVIGTAPIENVVRKEPTNGDKIILLGGRTGKDGIGGATGSSKQHNKDSVVKFGAEVQKGNAINERKIQRLFLNPVVTKLIKRCNDFGAGGVAVAVGELCDGLDINLNKVPKKYEGLNGTELAVSESQERMAVVVASKDVDKFIKLANDENLEATVIATVTNTNRLRMFWNNSKIVDLNRDFLKTNGAKQTTDVVVQKVKECNNGKCIEKQSINELIKQTLSSLNVCLKKGLVQKFDSTIGANTILMPYGGVNQLTPADGMVALIPYNNIKSNTASIMSYGFNPYLGEWSPFHMAYYAIIESITKCICLGGRLENIRLSLQEYFEKMKTNESWGKVFAALLGAYTIQNELNIPAIGGKDSMSGSYENINVPPTLISFAVDVTNANNICSQEVKQKDSTIVWLKPEPKKDYTINLAKWKLMLNKVSTLIQQKKIISASSLKTGGVFETICKMAIGNSIGVNLNKLTKVELFDICYGSLIVEIPNNYDVSSLLKGLNYQVIGKTIKEPNIVINNYKVKISLNDVNNKLSSKLKDVFNFETKTSNDNIEIPSYKTNSVLTAKKKVKTPLVLIPCFPGTNCELDSQRAWEKAGAKVKIFLFNNLNEQSLNKSINDLANEIKKANILMIPGGFSGADEPDGSAKFIVNVFRHKKVKDATMDLINNREGLILGICNGFQALIKLGLLPYGKIVDSNKDMPTLTYNDINHHMSSIVRTKLVSNKSPWFRLLPLDSITNVAISHGEGKLVGSEDIIQQLIKNGQVAMQYVDNNDKPTLSMPFNPNGSIYGIEAITSPDGRILGKMGHSERVGKHLYKNITGEFDQKIFESAVKYFK